MTPLFCVPGGSEAEVIPAPLHRPRPLRRPAAGRTRNPRKAGVALKDDMLAVTAERLRRALTRSFLRHGVAADLDAAVHAAMNVIEPVLEARDTEILRLRRVVAPPRPRARPGVGLLR